MAANIGNIAPAPVSVAERIAALEKGKDVIDTYKQPAAHKLHHTSARPWKNTAEILDECSSHLNYNSVKTMSSSSIDIARDSGRTKNIMTKKRSEHHPPVKPNTISMASRISALHRTISSESRSHSAHPNRNITTSIHSSTSCRATQPRRPFVLQYTEEAAQSSTIIMPDRLKMQEVTMTGKTAADGEAKNCPLSNQIILTDSGVHVVTPPKPNRQSPILKDVSNTARNKSNVEKSFNLPTKTNKELSQEAHREKENTRAETSFTGVSDVDSDMITLPASNAKAMVNSSFDTASSWNYEKTINGWQTFYKNYALPPPGVMLEAQINTPVIDNTSRKTNSNSDSDNVVIRRNNVQKVRRRIKKDDVSDGPSYRGHSKVVTSETEENGDDFVTDDSNEDFDLNGCFMIDEIWSAFSLLSSSV